MMEGQIQIGDVKLQLDESSDSILITINGDDVNIYSTLLDDRRTYDVLFASAMHIRKGLHDAEN